MVATLFRDLFDTIKNTESLEQKKSLISKYCERYKKPFSNYVVLAFNPRIELFVDYKNILKSYTGKEQATNDLAYIGRSIDSMFNVNKFKGADVNKFNKVFDRWINRLPYIEFELLADILLKDLSIGLSQNDVHDVLPHLVPAEKSNKETVPFAEDTIETKSFAEDTIETKSTETTDSEIEGIDPIVETSKEDETPASKKRGRKPKKEV